MMAIRIPGPTIPTLWKCLTTLTPHITEITNIRQIHTTPFHGTLTRKLDHITVHTRRCHKFHIVPPIIPGIMAECPGVIAKSLLVKAAFLHPTGNSLNDPCLQKEAVYFLLLKCQDLVLSPYISLSLMILETINRRCHGL